MTIVLTVLAEAVNAVADWPLYEALCSDDPVNRLVGITVGGHVWQYSLTDLRRSMPFVHDKRRQLERMLVEKPRHMELRLRLKLLAYACDVSNSASRRETARLVTVLGRWRAIMPSASGSSRGA